MMAVSRRQLFQAAFASFAAALPTAGAAATSIAPAGAARRLRPLVRAPRLCQGDWVALVAPSGYVDDNHIERSVRNLESIGLKVKLARNLRARRGNYAGTVKDRVEDLHHAFRDREVKALWAERGGSGAAGLLPHLDYRLIRTQPKIVIGYSDITALTLGLYRHAGLIGFHGVVSGSQFADYSVSHLRAVLMEGRHPHTIELGAAHLKLAETDLEYRPRVLRSGVTEGRLVGGNLSVLSSLVGTPYAAPLAGHLLFLEEISEAPYRIDRMLTQLERSQGYEALAGVALGVFRRSVDPEASGPESHTLTQVLEDRFAAFTKPAMYGLPFGHIAPQCVLPLGVRARLDTEAQTLTLLEPAVL